MARSSLAPSPPASQADRWAPLLVAAGAGLLFVLRFGYGFGTSDQDEFLPLLLNRLDPTLFTTDPFVQAQLEGGGVRGWFVGLLYLPALVLPVPAAVLVVYVAAFTGLATAVYRIGVQLTSDRVAAAAGSVAVLVLTPQWTLGGNDLAHSMLAPSMPAWALALWGLSFALSGRHLLAAIALGAATYLQALVGLQLAGLVGLMLAAGAEQGFRRAVRFAAVYALVAGLALAPLILGQTSGTETERAPSLFYIMAVFRNPHHYLPHAFSAHSVIRFGFLTVAGLGAFFYLWRRDALRHAGAVAVLLGGVAALGAVGYVGTEVVPTLFVAKLQLFKPTVLAKTVFILLLAGAAGRAVQGRLRRTAQAVLDAPGRTAIALGIAWSIFLAASVLPSAPLRHRLPALSSADVHLDEVAAWARTDTSPTARFMLPPSVSSFRTAAQRGVAVNFKAFPFEPPEVHAWYERLMAFAPLPPTVGGREVLPLLDAAYADLPPDRLLAAATRYDVAYVVRAGAVAGAGFAPVFEAGPWTVYRVEVAP